MKHEGTIESELTGGYQAACSCGWTGMEREDYGAAGRDLDSHYDEVSL